MKQKSTATRASAFTHRKKENPTSKILSSKVRKKYAKSAGIKASDGKAPSSARLDSVCSSVLLMPEVRIVLDPVVTARKTQSEATDRVCGGMVSTIPKNDPHPPQKRRSSARFSFKNTSATHQADSSVSTEKREHCPAETSASSSLSNGKAGQKPVETGSVAKGKDGHLKSMKVQEDPEKCVPSTRSAVSKNGDETMVSASKDKDNSKKTTKNKEKHHVEDPSEQEQAATPLNKPATSNGKDKSKKAKEKKKEKQHAEDPSKQEQAATSLNKPAPSNAKCKKTSVASACAVGKGTKSKPSSEPALETPSSNDMEFDEGQQLMAANTTLLQELKLMRHELQLLKQTNDLLRKKYLEKRQSVSMVTDSFQGTHSQPLAQLQPSLSTSVYSDMHVPVSVGMQPPPATALLYSSGHMANSTAVPFSYPAQDFQSAQVHPNLQASSSAQIYHPGTQLSSTQIYQTYSVPVPSNVPCSDPSQAFQNVQVLSNLQAPPSTQTYSSEHVLISSPGSFSSPVPALQSAPVYSTEPWQNENTQHQDTSEPQANTAFQQYREQTQVPSTDSDEEMVENFASTGNNMLADDFDDSVSDGWASDVPTAEVSHNDITVGAGITRMEDNNSDSCLTHSSEGRTDSQAAGQCLDARTVQDFSEPSLDAAADSSTKKLSPTTQKKSADKKQQIVNAGGVRLRPCSVVLTRVRVGPGLVSAEAGKQTEPESRMEFDCGDVSDFEIIENPDWSASDNENRSDVEMEVRTDKRTASNTKGQQRTKEREEPGSAGLDDLSGQHTRSASPKKAKGGGQNTDITSDDDPPLQEADDVDDDRDDNAPFAAENFDGCEKETLTQMVPRKRKCSGNRESDEMKTNERPELKRRKLADAQQSDECKNIDRPGLKKKKHQFKNRSLSFSAERPVLKPMPTAEQPTGKQLPEKQTQKRFSSEKESRQQRRKSTTFKKIAGKRKEKNVQVSSEEGCHDGKQSAHLRGGRRGGERMGTKGFCCLYCKATVAKIPRHFRQMHINEPEVRAWMKEKDKKKRDLLFVRLRNLGNHLHNLEVLNTGEGKLIVKRRSEDVSEEMETDLMLPCYYCFSYLLKNQLFRHVHSCPFAPAGVTLLARNHSRNSVLVLEAGRLGALELAGSAFQPLSFRAFTQADPLADVGECDRLITKLTLLKGYCDSDGDDVTASSDSPAQPGEKYSRANRVGGVTFMKCRLLSALLIQLRELTGKFSSFLEEFIHPDWFDIVLEAGKMAKVLQMGFSENVSGLRNFELLRMALGNCCVILQAELFAARNFAGLDKVIEFAGLVLKHWTHAAVKGESGALFQTVKAGGWNRTPLARPDFDSEQQQVNSACESQKDDFRKTSFCDSQPESHSAASKESLCKVRQQSGDKLADIRITTLSSFLSESSIAAASADFDDSEPDEQLPEMISRATSTVVAEELMPSSLSEGSTKVVESVPASRLVPTLAHSAENPTEKPVSKGLPAPAHCVEESGGGGFSSQPESRDLEKSDDDTRDCMDFNPCRDDQNVSGVVKTETEGSISTENEAVEVNRRAMKSSAGHNRNISKVNKMTQGQGQPDLSGSRTRDTGSSANSGTAADDLKPASRIWIASATEKRKSNWCFYCQKPVVKMVRHLRACHQGEEKVVELLNEQDEERREALSTWLRNRANFYHNLNVLNSGEGKLFVTHPRNRQVAHIDRYALCIYCLGLFPRDSLSRHKRNCSFAPQILLESESHTFPITSLLQPATELTLAKLGVVLSMGRADDRESEVMRSDRLISAVGAMLFQERPMEDLPEMSNSDCKRRLSRTRMQIKCLAKILMHLHNSTGKHDLGLEDFICPEYFDQWVSVVRELADSDTHNGFLRPVGKHLIARCVEILIVEAVAARDEEKEARLKEFDKLFQFHWSDLYKELRPLCLEKKNKKRHPQPVSSNRVADSALFEEETDEEDYFSSDEAADINKGSRSTGKQQPSARNCASTQNERRYRASSEDKPEKDTERCDLELDSKSASQGKSSKRKSESRKFRKSKEKQKSSTRRKDSDSDSEPITVRKVWSTEEREAVYRQLGGFIKDGFLPGKADIERCLEKEPSLSDRPWRKIKDFCRYIIAGKLAGKSISKGLPVSAHSVEESGGGGFPSQSSNGDLEKSDTDDDSRDYMDFDPPGDDQNASGVVETGAEGSVSTGNESVEGKVMKRSAGCNKNVSKVNKISQGQGQPDFSGSRTRDAGSSANSGTAADSNAAGRIWVASARDRKHNNWCFYCQKTSVKLLRHLRTWHRGEKEVIEFLNEQDEEKRELLYMRLRNHANFYHNLHVLKSGEGALFVSHPPNTSNMPVPHIDRYALCIYCLRVYTKDSLNRHKRRCSFAPQDVLLESESHSFPITSLLQPATEQTLAQLGVVLSMGYSSDLESKVMRCDRLICAVGAMLFQERPMEGLPEMSNSDCKRRLSRTRMKIKCLAKILMHLRNSTGKHDLGLEDFICPEYFDQWVSVVRELADSDTHNGFLRPVGKHLIARCVEILIVEAVAARDEEKEARLKEFDKLFQFHWSDLYKELRPLCLEKKNKKRHPQPVSSNRVADSALFEEETDEEDYFSSDEEADINKGSRSTGKQQPSARNCASTQNKKRNHESIENKPEKGAKQTDPEMDSESTSQRKGSKKKSESRKFRKSKEKRKSSTRRKDSDSDSDSGSKPVTVWKVWSTEEREAVYRQLGGFIEDGFLPGKADIERCLEKEPCLSDRPWRKVKDFCRNIISSDKGHRVSMAKERPSNCLTREKIFLFAWQPARENFSSDCSRDDTGREGEVRKGSVDDSSNNQIHPAPLLDRVEGSMGLNGSTEEVDISGNRTDTLSSSERMQSSVRPNTDENVGDTNCTQVSSTEKGDTNSSGNNPSSLQTSDSPTPKESEHDVQSSADVSAESTLTNALPQTSVRGWSKQEREAVYRQLGKFLITKTLPGKTDILLCIQKEYESLGRRSWMNVKNFCHYTLSRLFR